jgi:hypothetical protein
MGNQLVFAKDVFIKPVRLGNIRQISIPIANVTKVRARTVVPELLFGDYVGKTARQIIKSNKVTILQTLHRAITLPSAELRDSVANSDEVAIRRSMNGGTRTYVKRSDRQKFKYSFTVGKVKSRELRDFLLNYNSDIIQINNWKGEIWYAYLMNNPVELTATGRYLNEDEKVEITLEFEGVRIH